MGDFDFNPNGYDPNANTLVPIGKHRVRIDEVKRKVSKSSGNMMLEILLKVSGQASKLWIYLVKNEYFDQNLGAILESIGILEEIKTNPSSFTEDMLVGNVGAVMVKHETFEGEPKAKVNYWIKRKQQNDLPEWQEKASKSDADEGNAQYDPPKDEIKF